VPSHVTRDVRQFAKEMGIEYPVAIDNDLAIWHGFGNHYWPALYFLDPAGHVRDHHFGEGKVRTIRNDDSPNAAGCGIQK
jgi:hypothetical protein